MRRHGERNSRQQMTLNNIAIKAALALSLATAAHAADRPNTVFFRVIRFVYLLNYHFESSVHSSIIDAQKGMATAFIIIMILH